MSRLESNAEPSMEEILASIRKIIAEDSSGLRSPAAPQRPGTPYAPASKSTPLPASAPPRSGFMSREAFLKSSQPVEPEPASEFHAPVGAPRSNTSDFPSAATSSRLRPREDVGAIETPSSPFREPSPSFREKEAAPAKESLRAREDIRPKENVQAKETTQPPAAKEQPQPLKREPQTPQSGETISIDAASVETVTMETVPVEEVFPAAEDDAPTILTAEPEPRAPKSAVDSDAASIEAQLSELLSEDLNALREGRTKGQADATIAKAGEPKDVHSATPYKDIKDKPADSGAGKDGSDPFAFDLGPSPFAQKPEPQRPTPAQSSSSMPSSMSPFDSPRTIGRANNGERTAPANGSPTSSIMPKAPGIEYSTNAPAAASPQPEPAAAKPRQTFVVPSVSATIGPSRKLEPLSNAFRPAPAPETVIPTAEVVPEPDRAPDYAPGPVRAPPPSSAARNQHDETTVPHSTLPATTSDSSLDRPMEDAVADLLRPLLKTWLAENMPKIVERALRREMSERLLPGKKNPLD